MIDWDSVKGIWERNRQPSSRKLEVILSALGIKTDSGTIRQHVRTWREDNFKEIKQKADAAEADLGAYMWKMLKNTAKSKAAIFATNSPAVIRVDTATPIAVSFIADQHFGSYNVNYEQAEADAVAVGNTENVYAVLGGDSIDNFIKLSISSAMLQANTSPDEQLKLLEYYLKMFKGKILALVSGNHELWTSEMVGIDIYKHVIDKGLVPAINASYTAYVRLFVGDIEYKIMIRHKYRYNSSFNLTHTVKRMWEMGDFDFDIGVVCHHHEATYEPFTKHTEQKWAVRTGAYKLYDTFADKIGHKARTMHHIIPTAILYPDTKHIDMVGSIAAATKLIN